MKTLNKIFTILLLTIIISCGSDDDDNPPQVNNNEVIINGITYSINSASLGLDAGPSFNNQFSLIFTDGLLKVNSFNNGLDVDTNTTTMGVGVFVDLGGMPLSTEQAVVNNITTTTYNLSDDTRAISNIINFTNTYLDSGIQYGEINETGANIFEVNNTGSGTVTINSFSVNLIARTGMIDCVFLFTDENGKTISGNFNDSLLIHDDH